MALKVGKELMVGVVVLTGLVIFGMAVLTITQESRLFAPKVEYWTDFENTSGLAKGSPVRLIGVQIGTIDGIDLPTDLNQNKIKVTFKVDRAFAPRIRKGTVAYLKSLTYLSQDKYVELTPGDPAQPEVEPGSRIESGMSAWEETLLQSQGIADDVKEITASLRDLLVALNRGQGLVQEMIHNPEFGRQGVADFESSLASLRRLLEGIEEGRGLAGTLLRDKEFSKKELENLDGSLTHLRSVVERLDNPEGPVAQFTDPQGKGRAMMDDLHGAITSFRNTARSVEEGQGVVGRLTTDKAYADALLKKIDSATGHLNSILGKIDRGEGTLGGIVNDPEVYESLKDIVAGIEKSRLGKGMLRHYGKKGAEARPEGEEPAPDDKPAPPPSP